MKSYWRLHSVKQKRFGWALGLSFFLFGFTAHAEEAIAYGSGGCGRLSEGAQLPCSGKNFESFSRTACLLGRNYLHPRVTQTLEDAWAMLEKESPARRWQYGEMGNENGGRLWPHKTHQNGLSADFFVPVKGKQGPPTLLSISVFNGMGYRLEFNKKGELEGQVIDFPALGLHLKALAEAGARHGVEIERIILTPDFHQALFKSSPHAASMAHLFMKTEAWVRHDEHYHIDFRIPEKLRKPWSCSKR